MYNTDMKNIIIFVVVVGVVVAGVWFFRSGQTSNPMVSMMPSVSPMMSTSPTASPVRTTMMQPTISVSPSPTVSKTPVPKTVTVGIQNFVFVPATITVKRGDTVKFTNFDSVAHTVTSLTGAFDSGTMQQNATWSLSTAGLAAGTYQYRCNIHTSMMGTVVVQ